MLDPVLRLEPLAVTRPWGGRRLEALGRSLPPDVGVGESWEVADLATDGGLGEQCTRVAAGHHTGMRLAELIERFGAELLGSAGPTPDGRFPLLVKLLDARQHLSVQVHPPPQVADQDPAIRAKSESWYVLDADPGSRMWFDIRTDIEDAEVAAAAGTPAIVAMLGDVPAQVGAFHHIPAGRVHALGAGVMVLEIQTPSDTTFRMYDWGIEYDRPPRHLHTEAALRSIVRGDPTAISVAASDMAGSRTLVTTPEYWIVEHRTDGRAVPLDTRSELRVVTVAAGEVELASETLRVGDTRILPAASPLIGPLDAAPGSVVIETGLA